MASSSVQSLMQATQAWSSHSTSCSSSPITRREGPAPVISTDGLRWRLCLRLRFGEALSGVLVLFLTGAFPLASALVLDDFVPLHATFSARHWSHAEPCINYSVI